MKSLLNIQKLSTGVELEIMFPSLNSSTQMTTTRKHVKWTAKECDTSSVEYILGTLNCASTGPDLALGLGLRSVLSSHSRTDVIEELPVTFPCILLQAKFDCFSIIRAPQSFSVDHIVYKTEAGAGAGATRLRAEVFCAQEIWELGQSMNRVPGDMLSIELSALGLQYHASSWRSDAADGGVAASSNMILPLGHTPLLFALYTQRGRCFASGINITGDVMALTPVSLQWGKFYCDAILALTSSNLSLPEKFLWAEEGVKAIVSCSYALIERVAAWATGIQYVARLFPVPVVTPPSGDIQQQLCSAAEVLSRENITIHLAVAALVAAEDQPFAGEVDSWNVVLRTMFSRMSESISGTKMVRRSDLPHDLGSIEDAYRVHIGALQSLLQRSAKYFMFQYFMLLLFCILV